MPSLTRCLLVCLVSTVLTAAARAQSRVPPAAGLEPWNSLFQGSLSANLTPKQDIKLSSRAAGVVQQIHVSDGAHVKKGDPILSLDSRQEVAELAQNEANLRGTEADYERASNEFKRVSKMREDEVNMVTDKDFDAYRAVEALSRSRRDQAKAMVEAAKDKLESRTICSTIDGIFVKTTKSVGEAVERFEPIARVVDPSVLELVLYCETTYLGRFTKGQTVPVQVRYPQRNNPKVTGVIQHVDNFVDATSGTFRIKVDVVPSEDAIPGLEASLVVNDPAKSR